MQPDWDTYYRCCQIKIGRIKLMRLAVWYKKIILFLDCLITDKIKPTSSDNHRISAWNQLEI